MEQRNCHPVKPLVRLTVFNKYQMISIKTKILGFFNKLVNKFITYSRCP
jgi:hypothetical protein